MKGIGKVQVAIERGSFKNEGKRKGDRPNGAHKGSAFARKPNSELMAREKGGRERYITFRKRGRKTE